MKNFKKITAAIAATLMAASLSIPMAMPASAATITISGITAAEAHTFEVYQVFTGDLTTTEDGAKQLTNLKWGNGVTTYDGTAVTAGELVSDTIIDGLGTDARAIAKKIATSSTKACDDVTSSGDTVTIEGLADGYYIVKDVSNFGTSDAANSAYIVQVAGTATVSIKNAKPSVDKQVFDETTDAEAGATDGWGESADHAINESFQFKLTATIPADADLASYETYKLVFHDKMSDGVTFEDIASVTVNGTKITEGYTSTATAAAGIDWTLTIDDVKSIVNANDADVFGKTEFTVEVIYNAHLNENAFVDKASQTAGTPDNTNNNNVYLEYSNNPDHFGAGGTTPDDETGETPKDYVWVFTYGVDNTKYKIEATEGNELAGAKFSLHEGSETGNIIGMEWNDAKNAYIPTGSAGTAGNMESQADNGTFNIIGLDAGTYYLVEDEAPEGFNKAPSIKVVIDAEHSETNAESDNVTMTLKDTSEGMKNNIVDTKTSSLPETGGIGTKLFYIGGGCLVGLAGVLLITKKRAKNAQN